MENTHTRLTLIKRLTALFIAVCCIGLFVPQIEAAPEVTPLTGGPIVMEEKALKLWYDEPAPMGNEDASSWQSTPNVPDDGWEKWSLPLGNGYMGANVFGRTETERIQITENTLSNPYQSEGDKRYGGLNNFSETYIDFHHSNPENFRRELDLNNAISTVSYDYNGVHYDREYFTSYPDKVMVIRLTASQEGALSFTLRPTIPYIKDYLVHEGDGGGKEGTVVADGNTITLSGVLKYYGVEFEGQYRVINEGGTLTAANDENNDNGTITVTDANSATILIAVGTNYQLESRVFTEPDRLQKLAPYPHPHEKVTSMLEQAAAKDYETLRSNHITDYKTYFDRVKFDLGAEVPSVTTDELLSQYKAGSEDKYLEELYYQFGRYLLISSSRPGCMPANLQGIWNRYDDSPWSAGYWHNINVQMNYWPAFSTNLAEMFEPYVDYAEAYRAAAENQATSFINTYFPENKEEGQGANGWIIGVGGWPYSISGTGKGHSGPGTGSFTSILFWDYYDYTRDETILAEHTYPAVAGMANFLSKVLIEQDGALLAGVSGSPEQFHNGVAYTTVGCAFDQQMIWENHNDTLKAAELLGITNDEIVNTVRSQVDRLDPVNVGYSGQVKEFREENYYGEIGEYNHRHISQLVGLYPGTSINSETPAWLDAAKVTLNERGDKSTGWAMAHRLNLWARTGDGDRSYSLYQSLLKNGTLTNLWDTHPPFQIDGNLGGVSGVTEMLLQSHEGYISMLPSLPKAWANGSYKGLVARGNFEVGAEWKDGNAQTFEIKSNKGGVCRLKYFDIDRASLTTVAGDPVPFTKVDTDLIEFETTPGTTYLVTGIPPVEKVSAPSNLQVTTEDYEMVELNWSGSADAQSYNVYRALENRPSYSLIAEGVTNTSYTYAVPEDEAGRQATYKVVAVSNTGRESDGPAKVLIPVEVQMPESATAIQLDPTTLQVTVTGTGSEQGFNLYRYNGSTYEKVQYSEYPVLIIENADTSVEYAVSAVIGRWESDKKPVSIINKDNIMLKKPVTLLSGHINSSFPITNINDGELSTRCALSDTDRTFQVEFDLEGTYALDQMKIHDFQDGGDGQTRSDQTTIEVFNGSTWTTVIDKQPLNFGEAYTQFDMGGTQGSRIRITFNNTTEKKLTASIKEIECSIISLRDAPESNVLLNKEATATKSALTGYPVSNAFDGDMATRLAVVDVAGAYSITIDLDGSYILSKFRVYEFQEGRTRSQETTIKLLNNGTWTTVIDKQPLIYPQSYTEFDLGLNPAQQIRITFNNTDPDPEIGRKSCTIWEMTCSIGVSIDVSKKELLDTLERAKTVDTTDAGVIALARLNQAIEAATAVVKDLSVDQDAVDSAAAALEEAILSIKPDDGSATDISTDDTLQAYLTEEADGGYSLALLSETDRDLTLFYAEYSTVLGQQRLRNITSVPLQLEAGVARSIVPEQKQVDGGAYLLYIWESGTVLPVTRSVDLAL